MNDFEIFRYSDSQYVISKAEASTSHEKWLEIETLGPQPLSTESATLAVGLSDLFVHKPLRVLPPLVPGIWVGVYSVFVSLLHSWECAEDVFNLGRGEEEDILPKSLPLNTIRKI